MSKASGKPPRKTAIKPVESASPSQAEFGEVLALIDAAKVRAAAVVNATLMELYWSIGQYISRKIAEAGWGQGTVGVLAEYLQWRHPGRSGFSASNLWRMRQFFETYRGVPKLAALLRELSWSHSLAIMSRCKRDEEREFYLRLAAWERWPLRELERQLAGALFERVVVPPVKLSPPVTDLHPDAASIFEDAYLLEFLDFSPKHSETDLDEPPIFPNYREDGHVISRSRSRWDRRAGRAAPIARRSGGPD